MSDEKTEEPTHKKLEDARKKGQSPRSQDASTAISLLVMTVCLSAAAENALSRLVLVVQRMLEQIGAADSGRSLSAIMVADLVDAITAALPFILVALLAGLATSFAQVGFNVSFEPVTPNLDKVNPGSGLKKLLSVKSIVELVKTLAKAIALCAVLWQVLNGLLPLLLGSVYLQPPAIAALGWKAIIQLMGGAVLVFLIIGPLDFGLQKWLFLRDQKMSKDEIKREHKEAEGDPQMKGKRKQIAREMANSAPQQTVPGATVVVTNPTHYAVALRYVAGSTAVPVIVAKGADGEAMLIRRIAQESHVPIVSDPPLARALFRLPVTQPIPEQMFEAVAAILRWVELVKTAGV